MVLGHRKNTLPSKGSPAEGNGADVTGDDETVVDEQQSSVLMHIISQLRPGADLSRVTLPTFILEPRSMLERITNFMAHPEVLLPIPDFQDPVERFVAVVKFYLSGWHIKPPGVKKPLNPILGETFTGYWDYADGTRGYYISEQTSHHPPKSSYFFMAPEHHIRVDGTLKPRSKFLGNSAASLMEGIAILRLLNHNERYFITQPNMYARGILFGKMKYELGDKAVVRCPETGISAEIEFKTKGWVGGTYNAIGGSIKDGRGKDLFELSGFWTGEMHLKDLSTGKKTLLFDATYAKETPPRTRPLEEQSERESQRLWKKTTEAIKRRDHEGATDEKSKVENEQRDEAKDREDKGLDWHPTLFRRVKGGRGGPEEGEEDLDWIINARVDGASPEEQIKQVLNIAAVLPGQAPHGRLSIPARNPEAAAVGAAGVSTNPNIPRQAPQQQPTIPQQQQAMPQQQQPAQQQQQYSQPQQSIPQQQYIQPQQQQPILQQQQRNDLIDIGQHDAKPSTQLPVEPMQNMHIQNSASSPNPTPVSQRPNTSVARRDSETQEVDVYQDAES